MQTKTRYARLLAVGKRQAVLLPVDVRFEGNRVSIRECDNEFLIESARKPMFKNFREWLAAINASPMSPDFLQDIQDPQPGAVRGNSD